MARPKGTLPLSANFEVKMASPLDARCIIATKAELYLTSTWTSADGNVYTYVGMLVVVYGNSTNNGLYVLIDTDYTNSDNWVFIPLSLLTDFVNHYRDLNLHVSAELQTSWTNKENSGVAAGLISALKDGVSTSGDTLNKLYTLITGLQGSKQDALTFSTDIESDKSSTTKISAIKTMYDWAVGKFQAISTKLTNIANLANSSGWLKNDGAGNFIYSTPSKSDVGLGNVQNTDTTIAGNITQDSTHRFVTDTDKTGWNAKLSSSDIYNGLDQTTTGKALDATQGKTLSDLIAGKSDKLSTIILTSNLTDIQPDFSAAINEASTNVALSSPVSTFTNMPAASADRILRIKNTSTTTNLSVTLRTTDLVIGSITYQFEFMQASTFLVQIGKILEINYLFSKQSSTVIKVSIMALIQA